MKHVDLLLMPDMNLQKMLHAIGNAEDFKILDRYIESINTHSFENVKPLLAEQVEFVLSDKNCFQLKDIQEYFEIIEEEANTEIFQAFHAKLIFENALTKIYTYDFIYFGVNKLGHGSNVNGKVTNVFSLINNEWRLVLGHLSGS